MKEQWEDSILKTFDVCGGKTSTQDIYKNITKFLELTEEHLKKKYGRPAYQHQIRSHIANLVQSGELTNTSRGCYSLIEKGKRRVGALPPIIAPDVNFRAEILDMAYGESRPAFDLLPEQIDEPQKFYEGTSKTITVNAYERNLQARNACVEHYGAKCVVCGIIFQKKYGDIGKGFIHVHHIKPLGEIGAEYKVDPINDLCPVCPNCHAMLHIRKPPYSINELKAMLQK